MEYELDEKAPDPGMLWLAIGIGVFSVLASFFLAIYCAQARNVSPASQSFETAQSAQLSESGQVSNPIRAN